MYLEKVMNFPCAIKQLLSHSLLFVHHTGPLVFAPISNLMVLAERWQLLI